MSLSISKAVDSDKFKLDDKLKLVYHTNTTYHVVHLYPCPYLYLILDPCPYPWSHHLHEEPLDRQ